MSRSNRGRIRGVRISETDGVRRLANEETTCVCTPLIFGRYSPAARPDEAYINTLSAWSRGPSGVRLLNRLRHFLLWLIPIAVGLATVIIVWTLADSYPNDAATRWTAIGVVLAGGALLIALFGLPVAISQLFAVRRDLDQITGISDLERQLIGLIEEGALIALGMHDMEEGHLLDFVAHGLTVGTYADWVEKVGAFIRTNGGHAGRAEQYLFQLAGRGKPAHEELEIRLAYLRDNVTPKVR